MLIHQVNFRGDLQTALIRRGFFCLFVRFVMFDSNNVDVEPFVSKEQVSFSYLAPLNMMCVVVFNVLDLYNNNKCVFPTLRHCSLLGLLVRDSFQSP